MRAGLLDRPLTLMAVCSWDLKNNDYFRKQDRSYNSKDEEMNMKIPFTGGCSCGAIRYESTAEPIMMFKCHCRDCQQATGAHLFPVCCYRGRHFDSPAGNCVTISRLVSGVENINAA